MCIYALFWNVLTIASDPKYSVLAGLLQSAGVDVDALSAKAGGATVFAPVDSAFTGLSAGVSSLLEENSPGVLLRHVVPGVSLTLGDMAAMGSGFWDSVPGGPLSFEAAGVVTPRIGGVPMPADGAKDDVCDNGVIHSMDCLISDISRDQIIPTYKVPLPTPAPPKVAVNTAQTARARGAATSVSSVGGRKAMGLLKQLPFYMYGPPFNAAKQEEFEPISIAQPEGASVDYQLMPPGSVYVQPDSVNAAELNPVSGMSKYIGQTKQLVERTR